MMKREADVFVYRMCVYENGDVAAINEAAAKAAPALLIFSLIQPVKY